MILQVRQFLIVLLICIASTSLGGCSDPAKIALRTTSNPKGIAAVQQLTDQSVLAKVALQADRLAVRQAAVEKLTDPALLAKIANEAKDSETRTQAQIRLDVLLNAEK